MDPTGQQLSPIQAKPTNCSCTHVARFPGLAIAVVRDGKVAWSQPHEEATINRPQESRESAERSGRPRFRGLSVAASLGHISEFFSIYEFRFTIYDSAVFDIPATAYARLNLPH